MRRVWGNLDVVQHRPKPSWVMAALCGVCGASMDEPAARLAALDERRAATPPSAPMPAPACSAKGRRHHWRVNVSEDLQLPFEKSSDTSRDAAKRMGRQPDKVRADRSQIIAFLYRNGPSTDKEMQSGLHMAGDTQRPRRGELAKAGMIRKTDQRRDGGTLWELTYAGRGTVTNHNRRKPVQAFGGVRE